MRLLAVSVASLVLFCYSSAFATGEWKFPTSLSQMKDMISDAQHTHHDKDMTDKSIKKVQSLLTQPRSEQDVWQAYEICKKELEKKPSNEVELKLKAAEALLSYMRKKSNGNGIKADGNTCDTKENRTMWRTHGPVAMRLLEDIKSTKGKEPLYHFLYAEAFMYCSCADSIVKAALRGDAMHFKRNAKPLLETHPTYGDGVGHIFMGAFYLAAPWPVHSFKKGKYHFDAAYRIGPKSRRNTYYQGVVARAEKRPEDAIKWFKAALAAKPTSPEEADIGAFVLEQSKLALEDLQKST